jgi:hypothetical protein
MSEIGEFLGSWKDLDALMRYMLTTPLEEVRSNQDQKEKLNIEVDNLKKKAAMAQENFKKASSEATNRKDANHYAK